MQGRLPASFKRTRAVQGEGFKTRAERRAAKLAAASAAAREPERLERQAYWRDVASFVRTDDASRRRAIRLSSGSAYGAQHRAVAFQIGK